MKQRRTEEEEQKKVIAFCRQANIPVWASASGLWCQSIGFASKLRSLGIIATKGEPDLFVPCVKYKDGLMVAGGLFIELKREGGKATKEQLERVKYYNEHGYIARVAHGAELAIKAILEYTGKDS